MDRSEWAGRQARFSSLATKQLSFGQADAHKVPTFQLPVACLDQLQRYSLNWLLGGRRSQHGR